MMMLLTGVMSVIALLAFFAACGAFHRATQLEQRVTELDKRLNLRAHELMALASAIGDLAKVLKAPAVEAAAHKVAKSILEGNPSTKVH